MSSKVNVNMTISRVDGMYIPGFSINFLNGGFSYIPDRYGGYVIASGCGSGKTTAIKEMILKVFNYGVVYSAATIDECNKMYQFLVTEGPNNGLFPNDIVVLHSEFDTPGVDLNMMRSNSNDLHDKKVIICTHYKFLNEHPEILLKYNKLKNVSFKNNISRSHKVISGISDEIKYDLPRQNIFIDEVPTCKSIGIKIDSLKKSVFFEPEKYFTGNWIKNSKGEDVPEMKKTGNYVPLIDLEEFEDKCNEFKNSLGFFKEDCQSNKMRNLILSDLIYDNFNILKGLKDTESVNLTRTMSSLLYEDMKTRLMIFEGTGDLTFHKSELFNLLNVDTKYNSPIFVDENPIEFNIKRSYRNNSEFLNQLEFRNYEWDRVTNSLIDIITRPSSTGTLIVCWKGYKIKDDDPVDYIDSYDEVNKSYNESFNLSKNIELLLSKKGINFGYKIIHYMSGLDRATNEFREYNQIVFLGDFKVPDSVVGKFNFDYKVNTTPVLFRIYQMAQAVCRLCIRENSGRPISISYTSDIDKLFIDKLVKYLYNSPVEILDDIKSASFDFIKPKWRGVIEKLCELDYELKLSILNQKRYYIEVPLDLLYEILPMSRKESSKYNSLVNYLRGLGIEMKIISNARSLGFKS